MVARTVPTSTPAVIHPQAIAAADRTLAVERDALIQHTIAAVVQLEVADVLDEQDGPLDEDDENDDETTGGTKTTDTTVHSLMLFIDYCAIRLLLLMAFKCIVVTQFNNKTVLLHNGRSLHSLYKTQHNNMTLNYSGHAQHVKVT